MNPCTKKRHEEWRPVLGAEESHEVSSFGRVRSIDRIIQREYRGGDGVHRKGRMLTGHTDGRGRVSVKINGKSRKVHQLVLEAFVGPRPEGMEACHRDDDSRNNHLDNLRWDTKAGNMADRARNGGDSELRKTHCPKGHPYSGDNLILWKNGRHRVCRECHNVSSREWYWRNKGRAS